MSASETLRVWMATADVGTGELARRVGVSPQFVSQLRRGRRVPSLEVAVAIERATEGAVATTSWARARLDGRTEPTRAAA